MACLTSLRRPFELNFVRPLNRLVAIAANDRTMRANQRKFRLRMIEAPDIDPRSRVVTSFAAQRSSVRALLRHALLELALVRIGVACRASAILKMEGQDLVGSAAQSGFMAIGAGDGDMGSGEQETRVLVLRNCKRRMMKILYGVALFAAILVGRSGELLIVRILVAIRAGREFHFVNRVFARGCVAFFASHSRMFSLQRIVGCRMFLRTK